MSIEVYCPKSAGPKYGIRLVKGDDLVGWTHRVIFVDLATGEREPSGTLMFVRNGSVEAASAVSSKAQEVLGQELFTDSMLNEKGVFAVLTALALSGC